MSFILDALKKSETERQEQRSTEFAAVPTRPARSPVPAWLWVVAVLLLVNLTVLVGLFLRSDTGPVPLAAPITEVTPQTAIEAPGSAASFADRVNAARDSLPERQQPVRAAEAEIDAAELTTATLISQDPAKVAASDIYPSLLEVRAKNSIEVPDMHLDIHVYSASPDGRFVFINMTKYREGERMDAGPQIVEILPTGVLLRHQGQTFLLARE